MSSSECVLLMLVVTVVETGDDPAGAKTESQESDTHFPSKILELELSMHLLHALCFPSRNREHGVYLFDPGSSRRI